MIRLKSMRPTVAVVLAAVLIIAAGGAAVASNMGFKMNKPLVKFNTLLGTTQTGNNWTSMPYHNPYGTFNAFCTQTGLLSTGLTTVRTGITVRNYPGAPVGFHSFECGRTSPFGGGTLALAPGRGFQIRQPNCPASPACPGATTVDSIIIVGSHNSGQPIVIDRNVSYWLSVPYHSTWVNTLDFCSQATLTSTGLFKAGVTRLNPGPPGAFQSTLCGATTNPFNLVLGEMIQVFEPTKTQVTFSPAHY